MAVNADGVEMETRNIGYFASQAEARLFAAALLLTVQQLSPDEVMREAGFTLDKDDTEIARWKRRVKSGDLQIRIKPEVYINPIHFDRELYLSYNGDKAKRIVRVVFVCPASNRSSANYPEPTHHPANGILADPFAADILAALTIADARLTLGNIRKPLDDGNEIAFIEEMVARRDASFIQTTSGMRLG